MPRIPGVGYRVVRQSGHAVMSNGEVNAYTMGARARDVRLTPAGFLKLR